MTFRGLLENMEELERLRHQLDSHLGTRPAKTMEARSDWERRKTNLENQIENLLETEVGE